MMGRTVELTFTNLLESNLHQVQEQTRKNNMLDRIFVMITYVVTDVKVGPVFSSCDHMQHQHE